jgi:hypothetical protein
MLLGAFAFVVFSMYRTRILPGVGVKGKVPDPFAKIEIDQTVYPM